MVDYTSDISGAFDLIHSVPSWTLTWVVDEATAVVGECFFCLSLLFFVSQWIFKFTNLYLRQFIGNDFAESYSSLNNSNIIFWGTLGRFCQKGLGRDNELCEQFHRVNRQLPDTHRPSLCADVMRERETGKKKREEGKVDISYWEREKRGRVEQSQLQRKRKSRLKLNPQFASPLFCLSPSQTTGLLALTG